MFWAARRVKEWCAVSKTASMESRPKLPQRNGMPQTQDMTPHPVTVYRHRADLSNDVERHIGIHNYSFQCVGSEILPIPSTRTPANDHLDGADMMVVIQKLSREYTVPAGS